MVKYVFLRYDICCVIIVITVGFCLSVRAINECEVSEVRSSFICAPYTKYV